VDNLFIWGMITKKDRKKKGVKDTPVGTGRRRETSCGTGGRKSNPGKAGNRGTWKVRETTAWGGGRRKGPDIQFDCGLEANWGFGVTRWCRGRENRPAL